MACLPAGNGRICIIASFRSHAGFPARVHQRGCEHQRYFDSLGNCLADGPAALPVSAVANGMNYSRIRVPGTLWGISSRRSDPGAIPRSSLLADRFQRWFPDQTGSVEPAVEANLQRIYYRGESVPTWVTIGTVIQRSRAVRFHVKARQRLIRSGSHPRSLGFVLFGHLPKKIVVRFTAPFESANLIPRVV